MVKIKYLLILGIISLFLIAACGQQTTPSIVSVPEEDDHEHGVDDVHEDEEEHEETSMEVPAPGNEDVEEMAVADSNVKEFDIIAKNWEFVPSVITVNKGDKVKLNIRSIDVAHGIAIPEFNVDVKFKPGEQAIAEFIADKAGEFSIICNVYCGRGHSGMRGLLVVE